MSDRVDRSVSKSPPLPASFLDAGPAAAEEPNQWFAEQVQPHETHLRNYLRRVLPAVADIDDLVQESYLRLLRARAKGTLRSIKGFLFTTARNAAWDVFRRPNATSLDAIVETDETVVRDDSPGVADLVSRDQELDLLTEAIQSLPARCGEILALRKLCGLSHKEIAARLGISEGTVNVQVGRGMRRCLEYLEQRGVRMHKGESTHER